jgi:8-oxo-dGTP diphosphatase
MKNEERKPHYHVVAALVECEGEYLCMQRGKAKYDYTSYRYEFPGGKVEAGETEEDALKRELKEEMNYEVEVVRHLTTIEHHYEDFSVTLSIHLCKAQTKEFEMREHVDFKWMKAENMASLPWVEADKEFVEKLHTFL